MKLINSNNLIGDMMKIKKPFLMLNTKSYLYGKELYDLAKHADYLTEKYKIDFFFTVPTAELYRVNQMTKKVIVTAQHMDYISPGKGMGKVTTESIIEAGAQAVVLNHAEKPITFTILEKTIEKANKFGLITIVCANSINEATKIVDFKPTIILCEPTEMIGTGQISDEDYIERTNSAIKNIDTQILVMQGAGISTEKDIIRNLNLGADGNGVTSGVVSAANPKEILTKMVDSTARFIQ